VPATASVPRGAATWGDVQIVGAIVPIANLIVQVVDFLTGYRAGKLAGFALDQFGVFHVFDFDVTGNGADGFDRLGFARFVDVHSFSLPRFRLVATDYLDYFGLLSGRPRVPVSVPVRG
jgi:hypothetical protein